MAEPLRGRGALANPAGRFERLSVTTESSDLWPDGAGESTLATEFYRDTSRTILTRNDSPDVGLEVSINPYRGCEHGCIYCYARPYHEYLGLSAGIDFERRIFVKEDAPTLLRAALSAKTYTPGVIGLSGVTDCYQPIERVLKLTRGCLEVLAEARNPVTVITKSHLVTRDIDLLGALARLDAAEVMVSLTTLDDHVAGVMEPRAARPARRLDAIRALAAAGVPVGVMVAPIVPGLTDHEVPAILEAAAAAGARTAGRTVVRLPYGVKDLFSEWLAVHFPDRRDKLLNRLREMRGGQLNDSTFGRRMTGDGEFARAIHAMFDLHRRRLGLTQKITLSTACFRRPSGQQPSLF